MKKTGDELKCGDDLKYGDNVKCGELISYINTELGYIYQELENRRLMVFTAIKLYSIALGGYLIVISVGINNSLSNDPIWSKAYGWFGLLCVFFMIMIGSCFNLFLGYNFQRILIAKKNRFELRKVFMSNYEECLNRVKGEVFLLEPHLKRVPKTEVNAQYWAFSINCILAITMVYFWKYIAKDWYISLDISLFIGCILSLVLPRLSVNYAKYIIIGKSINKNRNEKSIRKAYRKWYKRCESLKKTKLLKAIHLFAMIFSLVWIVMFFIDCRNTPVQSMAKTDVLILHCIIILFFVIACVAKFYQTTPHHYPAFGSFVGIEDDQ